MSAALAFAGMQAGLELMGGLFGYFTGQQAAGIAESRARLISAEAEADDIRYVESTKRFKASQKLAFLKSGVTLEGSPIDILDETARISAENLSARRANTRAQVMGAEFDAMQARVGGRNALIGGITGGVGKVGTALYQNQRTQQAKDPRND